MTAKTGTTYETQAKNKLAEWGYWTKNLGQNEAGDLIVLNIHQSPIEIEVKSTKANEYYFSQNGDQHEILLHDSMYNDVWYWVRFLRRKWVAFYVTPHMSDVKITPDDGMSLEEWHNYQIEKYHLNLGEKNGKRKSN